jgi:hypothetical protein
MRESIVHARCTVGLGGWTCDRWVIPLSAIARTVAGRVPLDGQLRAADRAIG